ncbi:hypothetical protein EV130_109281 [Rhizobium azibense]|uniref:Uncharacterized protein n=1 Tax=Rhizobium azibense TaxID=1136135 RepID=A0A4R3QMP2_9HYPH|nr:hypothetical protein EV130_109281 [Rhizobium azibense]
MGRALEWAVLFERLRCLVSGKPQDRGGVYAGARRSMGSWTKDLPGQSVERERRALRRIGLLALSRLLHLAGSGSVGIRILLPWCRLLGASKLLARCTVLS